MDDATIKRIVNSNIWFLVAGILFLIGSVRDYMIGDSTGAVIYFLAFILFLLGFALQVINSEKKKDEKSMTR